MGPGETAGKQLKKQPKQSQPLFMFQLFSGCLTGTLPGTYSAPNIAVFRLSSKSGIPHTSLDGHRDSLTVDSRAIQRFPETSQK